MEILIFGGKLLLKCTNMFAYVQSSFESIGNLKTCTLVSNLHMGTLIFSLSEHENCIDKLTLKNFKRPQKIAGDKIYRPSNASNEENINVYIVISMLSCSVCLLLTLTLLRILYYLQNFVIKCLTTNYCLPILYFSR